MRNEKEKYKAISKFGILDRSSSNNNLNSSHNKNMALKVSDRLNIAGIIGIAFFIYVIKLAFFV